MTFTSIGDLATSLFLNRTAVSARANINRLSAELTTGLVTDSIKATGGDYAGLSDWEQKISFGQVLDKTLAENFALAQVKGNIVETMRSDTDALANDIDLVIASNQASGRPRASQSASAILEGVVARLNTKVGTKALFSGQDTDAVSIASSETLLSSAKSVLSGAVTTSDVMARINTWIEDPLAGFSVDGYLGSAVNAAEIRLNDQETLALPGKGDDVAIKQVLKQLVLAALTTDSDLGFSPQVQKSLLETVSSELRSSSGALTDLQAQIGLVESRIESARSRNSSSVAVAKEMRLSLLAADPYETATRLQASEQQLEKIFALTARASRMSLLEYLR